MKVLKVQNKSLIMIPLMMMVALLSVSCAINTAAREKEISDAMASWVGSHQSAVIQSWGPPSRSTSDGNDGSILIYEENVDLGQTPGGVYQFYGNVYYTNPRDNSYIRTRMFYIDKNGYVYSCRWQGL
jgi:hypothetical protein